MTHFKGTTNLEDSIISENYSYQNGGAIYSNKIDGKFTIKNT